MAATKNTDQAWSIVLNQLLNPYLNLNPILCTLQFDSSDVDYIISVQSTHKTIFG
jgi:hypothetical protein